MDKAAIYQELDGEFLATFMGELMPGVLHNFANPLNGIMGRAKLLQRRLEDSIKKMEARFPGFAQDFGAEKIIKDVHTISGESDRFLILFRYMRMYALLIPLFLAGVYIINRSVTMPPHEEKSGYSMRWKNNRILYAIGALGFVLLLAHLHKLSMIILPVFGLFIVYLVMMQRSKEQIRLFFISIAGVSFLLLLSFVIKLDALRMFPQVADKIFSAHKPMTAYFEFVLGNGLPLNSTLMVLIGGLGLFASGISRRLKNTASAALQPIPLLSGI
jgi:hypothetical protein